MKRVIVTGGAGFIGANLCHALVASKRYHVLNIDKLTEASCRASLAELEDNPAYTFLHADICDGGKMRGAVQDFAPDGIMHLAAETHVDRSIDGALPFVQTNLVGTFSLLEAARAYWMSLDSAAQKAFRFLHVSTDEVFGSLGADGLFTPESPYDPSSPYSASKAGADHLVRAWHRTYGLPALITNCSNNYGPYQFPEKLIPLMILNALEGQGLPVYGKGNQVRDWLHVSDHVSALIAALEKGAPGDTYLVGGRSERENIDVVRQICTYLDEACGTGGPRERLIEHVEDRPGHDQRYAIDASATEKALDWKPTVSFEEGLRHTVDWYLANESWWRPLRERFHTHERIGLGATV